MVGEKLFTEQSIKQRRFLQYQGHEDVLVDGTNLETTTRLGIIFNSVSILSELVLLLNFVGPLP